MVDISFYNIVVPILAISPFVSLAIICLILKKGQLCPGQHSRIQGELITIWTVVFVSLMMAAETHLSSWIIAIGVIGGIYGILLSIWQGKLPNKRAIPDKAIYGALVPVGIYALGVLIYQANLFVLLPVVITGCVLAQLLLVKAKHRLEAFNRLLPMIGVIASVVSLVILAWLLGTNDSAEIFSQITPELYWFFGFLTGGLALWLLPLFSSNEQSFKLLGIATFLTLISQILVYEVIVIIG